MNQERFPFLNLFLNNHNFYNNIDQNELTTLEMHVIWPYINALTKTFADTLEDIEVMEKCLEIYNADEFRQLIEQYDRIDIFSNVYTTLPKLVPYKKLIGDQLEISKAGFYQCFLLRDDLKDQDIRAQFDGKIKETLSKIKHSSEFFDNLVTLYFTAHLHFTYPIYEEGPERKFKATYRSGCLTLFDSNNRNFLFD